MNCTNCTSRGLINNDTEICPDCKGLGHDGFESSIVEAKVEAKPAKKKLSKIRQFLGLEKK